MPGTIANFFGRVCNQLGSVFPPGSSSSFDEKSDSASAVVGLTESTHDRKRPRKMPFTVETFQHVMERMSISSSWVASVICRADVPAFEKTVTQMPLYQSSSAAGETEQAIGKGIFLPTQMNFPRLTFDSLQFPNKQCVAKRFGFVCHPLSDPKANVCRSLRLLQGAGKDSHLVPQASGRGCDPSDGSCGNIGRTGASEAIQSCR